MTQNALTPDNPISGGTAQKWMLTGQITDADPVREYQVHDEVFTVGRSSNCSLCLPVGCVSKNHAEIHLTAGKLNVRDLGSTNGTFVNGTQIEEECGLKNGDLVQFASLVFRVGVQGQITEHQTIQKDNCDQALAMMQFDRLIDSGAFFPFFQPIVRMDDQSVVGYEVLGRSKLFGMQSPIEMFSAASQLNLESQLSEMFRNRGIEVGAQLGDTNLFVNTHPKELGTEEFYKSLRVIREFSNHRITLEIHERAMTDSKSMEQMVSILKELDIQLAFDDFGVGEARLVELGEYRPDYLKFDMELTRSLDSASKKHLEVVRLLAKLVSDLGILPLAEGIENETSHQMLVDMGFVLGQGCYYGRPQSVTKILGDRSEG